MGSYKIYVALLLILLGGCGNAKAPAIRGDFALTKITDSVYVIFGPNEEPTAQNQGFMNNPGFVLTKAGVVVVDPGGSVQVGELLLNKIRSVTTAPVIAVFNTHIHGDHWLGNQAIRAAYPRAVIYAHPNMIRDAAVAGQAWINHVLQSTDGAIKGTRLVMPDVAVDDDDTLALSNKHFRIYHNGVAHTDGDIMVEVEEDRALFLGDNVVNARAGRLDDGNFKGNISAIDVALKSPALYFIPGHGKSGGPEIARAYQAYLKSLYLAVRKYRDQGLNDYEMKDKVAADLSQYQHWALFNNQLGRSISLAYLQIEADSF